VVWNQDNIQSTTVVLGRQEIEVTVHDVEVIEGEGMRHRHLLGLQRVITFIREAAVGNLEPLAKPKLQLLQKTLDMARLAYYTTLVHDCPIAAQHADDVASEGRDHHHQ
jgi:hypothetical protein